MRIRAILPMILLVPAALSAQRIGRPRIIGRTPAQPAPLPPQPNFIRRDMYFKSLRFSVESYPLLSYMQATNTTVGPSSWATLAEGMRLDYRVKPYLSATFDGTYSILGGPTQTQTMEFGTRFRPERRNRTVHPFLDARFGYTWNSGTYGVSGIGLDVTPYPQTNYDYGRQLSRGIGAVAGAGMDFALTNTLALTTEMTATRSRMNLLSYSGSQPPANSHFMLSQYRLSLGLKYNPGRWVPQVGPGTL